MNIESTLWELISEALIALTLNNCDDLIIMINSADKHALMANYNGFFTAEKTLAGGEVIRFLGIQVKETKTKSAPIIVRRVF